MTPKYAVSIMACARWETAYITEWLLYHRSIGFDHVYLYCNDDDPIDLYGQVLPFCRGAAPYVTFHHFPFQGQQFHMMMHGLRHHKDETEWLAFLDIDEFLVLPGLDDIKGFLAQCPSNWDSVHFNWSFFGNNGHVEPKAGSVLRNYTRRENRVHPSTKTVTRTAKIDLSRITDRWFIWHGWGDLFGPNFVAVNVLGDAMQQVQGSDEGASYVAPGEIQARIRGRGFINHYAFKSEHEFERRFERGLLGDFSGQIIWKRIADGGGSAATLATLNAVEDTYLADYWGRFLSACQKARIVPPVQLPNVALGKHADQSSISEWSLRPTREADAAGALSGVITGGMQFCTSMEAQPWWSVDLGAPHLIYEVRVFNRVDQPAMRERLGAFRIEVSDSADQWTTIYTNDGSRLVGGADGEPLILRFATPITLSYLRIVALGYTFLHLDQVELYGVERGDSLGLPAIGKSSTRETGAAGPAGPVVHVQHRGLLGNRMIEYMAAHAIASAVPGCRLSGVHLPEWGIDHPDLPVTPGTREVRVTAPRMRIGRAELIRDLRSGKSNRVHIDSYAQHMDNFLPRHAYANLFPSQNSDVPRAGPHELLIHIRCDNVLHPVDPDYVLTPCEFYEELVAQTGLRPVFMGQIGDNSYCQQLRARFPGATFLPRRNEVDDFETLRRARNIVTSVSTFAWMGAWLSNADRIYFPVNGFLNPAQYPEINLLPLDDPHYRFYLFSSNFAVPEPVWPKEHATLRGLWRLMDSAMIAELHARQPRFGDPLDLIRQHFDEAFYLNADDAVRAAVEIGAFKNGFDHYVRYGRAERREPFPLDRAWYGQQYPIAAIEVGQGDFADFYHHYAAIGHRRGYRRLPPGQGNDDRVADTPVAAPAPEILRYPETAITLDNVDVPTPYRPTFPTDQRYIDAFHCYLAEHAPESFQVDLGIDGWLQHADALKLYEIAYHTRGDVLELGTKYGLSAYVIAMALKATDATRRLITVDIDAAMMEPVRRNLAEKAVLDRVDVRLGDADDVCRALAAEGRRFEFTFVDHSHAYEPMLRACDWMRELVAPGGFVLFHDYKDVRNRRPPFSGDYNEYGVLAAVLERLPSDFQYLGCFGCAGLYRRA